MNFQTQLKKLLRKLYPKKLPKKRMGAGCLLFDNSGKLLILKPTYKDNWLLPGGVVEKTNRQNKSVSELTSKNRENFGLINCNVSLPLDADCERINNLYLFTITKLTMTTYYYVAASQKFLLEEEPFEEVIEERIRNYQERNKEIDFWFVKQPAFLEAPEMADIKAKIPQPAAAVITTNKQLATWLKLRLEYVITDQFEAPSETIAEPLASLTAA